MTHLTLSRRIMTIKTETKKECVRERELINGSRSRSLSRSNNKENQMNEAMKRKWITIHSMCICTSTCTCMRNCNSPKKKYKRTNEQTNIHVLRNFIKLQNSDHTLIELSLSCVWVKTIKQCVSSDLIAVFRIGWSTNRLRSAIDSRLRGYEWTKQENALVSFSIHVCVRAPPTSYTESRNEQRVSNKRQTNKWNTSTTHHALALRWTYERVKKGYNKQINHKKCLSFGRRLLLPTIPIALCMCACVFFLHFGQYY